MQSLPYEYARRHKLFVRACDSNGTTVVYQQDSQGSAESQLSITALLEVQRNFCLPLELITLDSESFKQQLQEFYQSLPSEDLSQFGTSTLKSDGNELNLLEDGEAPVVQLLNRILSQAIKRQASDIHIEPYKKQLAVRLRIDGVLQEIAKLDTEIGPKLISRIKILSNLDIAEQRQPQDGRVSVSIADKQVDLRISIIPASFGERVVLRLLNKSEHPLSLSQLGMPDAIRDTFERAIQQPNGIVLVTGPTGAGKTTTLYAALQGIDSLEKNILTVEDPIEYELSGIGQVAVNKKIDMSFAKALRAILRQDPDVLMVGEIRDTETAQIAIQASLTGHLVLSTLHTNTASAAIERLMDLQQDSFLLASSLRAIIAQRLVRLLCSYCKSKHRLNADEANELNRPDLIGTQVYQAQGCSHCDDSGYKGRTGVYEIITISDDLKNSIQNSNSGSIKKSLERHPIKQSTDQQLQTNGSLIDHGLTLLLEGKTTTNELRSLQINI